MYENSKATKLLKLVLALLAAPKTRISIQADLDIEKSTFHNYLNTLKEIGFDLHHENGNYSINHNSVSKSFAENQYLLTTLEKLHVKMAIEELDCDDTVKYTLMRKLISGADDNYFIREFLSQEDQEKAHIIQNGIEHSKQLLFADYMSGNSGTCKSRRVEAFAFSNDFSMVWTYDVDKQAVRLFKISRIREVIPFNEPVQYKNRHIKLPSDIFRIVGVCDKPIEIELNNRAYNLLTEEYPESKNYTHKLSNDRFSLKTHVATFDGVGRFVIGLMDDVTVIESIEFKQFLKEKLQNMTNKFLSPRKLDNTNLSLQTLPESTNKAE